MARRFPTRIVQNRKKYKYIDNASAGEELMGFMYNHHCCARKATKTISRHTLRYAACKVDIGILMDESGSVNAEDWKREKDFVSDLTGHFKLGRDAAQFGVISFSTNAHLDIPLNGNSNSASFKRVVNNLKQAREYCVTKSNAL